MTFSKIESNINVGKGGKMENNYLIQNLSFLRKYYNLSSAQLAQNLKVSEETVLGWEMGVQQLEVKDVMKVSKFYGVDVHALTSSMIKKSKNFKNQKDDKRSSQKRSKSAIIVNAIIIALSLFTIISFVLNCYAVDFLGVEIYFIFFDFVKTKDLTAVDYSVWIIIITIVFNLINGVLLCCSRIIRNSIYGKIGKVLTYSFNTFSLVCWISVMILQRDFKIKFTAIWLLVVFALILIVLLVADIILILSSRDKQPKVKKQKSPEKPAIFVLRNIINIVLLVGVFIALTAPTILAKSEYMLYAYWKYNSIDISLLETNFGPIFVIVTLILISLAIALIVCRKKELKKAIKVLSFISLVISAILVVLTLVVMIDPSFIPGLSEFVESALRGPLPANAESFRYFVYIGNYILLVLGFAVGALILSIVNTIVCMKKNKEIEYK